MKSIYLLGVMLATSMLTGPGPAHAASPYTIRHLEPAFWWVGMKHKELQLLVHGERIADLTPVISHPGIALRNVTRGTNRNYLFIDLSIGDDARAGEFVIRFEQAGKPVLNTTYRLHAREPGSAQRQGFSSADVIYLITPDRFANGNPANDNVAGLREQSNRSQPGGRHGGDIAGIRKHLDYIAGMGFTGIWSTPLMENNQPHYSYHGYAATDLYRIDARFGSNTEYRQLVAEAKTRGIGVIQDIVLNHIGSEHWWMKDMPTADWVNFPDRYVETTHNRTTIQDPYASDIDRKHFTDGWFVKEMPDLNQRNPLVANYLIQNSIWWVEYAGLSGIRTDTYSYSDKNFLTRWSQRVMDEYPNLNIVGEEWSPNPAIVSYWQRGKINHDGYVSHTPSMMDFPLYEALRHALVAPEEPHVGGFNKLYEALANDFQYPDPGNLVIFEGNHDTSRIFAALNEDPDLVKMAMVYLATMRGIPQVFYGTEILMNSPKHRDDGVVRSDFPGGWAGDKVNAFTGEGLTAQQKDAQQFMRALFNWRKKSPVIHSGKLMHYAPENGTYVYFRYDGKQKVMVALNKNKAGVTLDTARFHQMLGQQATGTDVISGQRHQLHKPLTVPPRSALVLEVRE